MAPRKNRPVDQRTARALALGLPETTEGEHRGRADIRVRNKIFATLPEDGATVNLKTTPVNLDAMVAADPESCAGLGLLALGLPYAIVCHFAGNDMHKVFEPILFS